MHACVYVKIWMLDHKFSIMWFLSEIQEYFKRGIKQRSAFFHKSILKANYEQFSPKLPFGDILFVYWNITKYQTWLHLITLSERQLFKKKKIPN